MDFPGTVGVGRGLDEVLSDLQNFGASDEDLEKARNVPIGENSFGTTPNGTFIFIREGENTYRLQTTRQ